MIRTDVSWIGWSQKSVVVLIMVINF